MSTSFKSMVLACHLGVNKMDKYILRFYPEETGAISWCNEMKNLKLVEIQKEEYVYCAHPDDDEYSQLSTDESECNGLLFVSEESRKSGHLRCEECGRTVRLEDKQVRDEMIVVRLKIDMIQELIGNLLSTFADEVTQHETHFAWEVTLHHRYCTVAILEFSPLELLLEFLSEQGGFIGISCETHALRRLMKVSSARVVVELKTLLEMPEILTNTLEVVLADKRFAPKLEEYKQILDNFVQSLPKSGLEFEEFVQVFEGHVFRNPDRIRANLDYLRINSALLLHTVRVGGSGRPDLVRIPVYNLMLDYFTQVGTIETKRFERKTLSKLTWELFTKAKVHADARESRTIFYVTTDAIAPSVWDYVFTGWRRTGVFPAIVLDRSLISLIMSMFEITSLSDVQDSLFST